MRNKLIKTLAAVTLAVAMPMGLATQADARPVPAKATAKATANSQYGCSVTPRAPRRVLYAPGHRTSVNYPTYAWCHNGLRVWVQDRQYVRYGSRNYLSGSDFWFRSFPTWPQVINRVHWLPSYSRYPIGTYHKVRFSVSNGRIQSGWSSWETSPTTWIWR